MQLQHKYACLVVYYPSQRCHDILQVVILVDRFNNSNRITFPKIMVDILCTYLLE